MIRTESVYSPIEAHRDGLRVLATRFRGRRLRKHRYHIWMANLAPSEQLLRVYHSNKVTSGEFARRYRAELFKDGPLTSTTAQSRITVKSLRCDCLMSLLGAVQ